MELRGVRPNPADYTAVAADASALGPIIDRYLTTPAFAEMVRRWQAELWQLDADDNGARALPLKGLLSANTLRQVYEAVYDEVPRLVTNIVVNDRPFTEIVTANYTMLNGVSRKALTTPPTDPAALAEWQKPGWQPWPITGRSPAGILSTYALYARHTSTTINAHRGRANMVAKNLWCHNYLSNDVVLDGNVNLADPEAVANAVRTNPSCLSCHQTLDPLGSNLYGNFNSPTLRANQEVNNAIAADAEPYPVSTFSPPSVDDWNNAKGSKRAPGFYGLATPTLAEFGAKIAADRRFAECSVRQLAARLTQVEIDALDAAWMRQLTDDFVASGYQLKAAARAIVLSPQFAVVRPTTNTTPELEAATVGTHRATPWHMSRTIEALTGFQWNVTFTKYGTADMMTTSVHGYSQLAGGTEWFQSPNNVRTFNVTTMAVVENLASEAADYAIANPTTVMKNLNLTATDETTVRNNLVTLQLRLFGETVAANDPLITAAYNTYKSVGDSARAWKVTLAALLQDPRLYYY